MRKIILMILFTGLYVYLFSRDVNEFDNGYIARIKKNECVKVKDYPGKDVRPSILLKDPSCEVTSMDDTIKSLIIVCTDKVANKSIIYSYAKTIDTCRESLAVAKKKGY